MRSDKEINRTFNDNSPKWDPKKISTLMKNYVNVIVIVGLLLLNVLISLMYIEDGEIILTDFSNYTWIDWVLWTMLVIIPAVITTVARTVFQREGIRQAKLEYPEVIKQHRDLLIPDEKVKIRSEKEYLTEYARKYSLKIMGTALIVSFVTTNLLVGIDTNGILRLLINLIVSVSIGYMAFGAGYHYGLEELRIWYTLDIKRLEELNRKGVEPDGVIGNVPELSRSTEGVHKL